VSSIDYTSWAFFFNLHRLFNQYSLAKPAQLNLAEMQLMLKDIFIPKEVVMAIDLSRTNFEQSAYQEASIVLQKLRVNEREFFFGRFKQDGSATTSFSASESTKDTGFYDIVPNEKNREIFFSTMIDTDKVYWTKLNMFRGFQLANLYVQFTGFGTKSRVVTTTNFVDKLPTFYDTIKPATNMIQRSNYVLYKALPREIGLDLLCFLALENYAYKFKIHSMSSNSLVNETNLKLILKDYGMSYMPDTVIDTGFKSYDALHRRQFSPLDVAKATIVVHAAASENVRGAETIVNNKLVVNADPSRAFPGPPRRFASSPLV